MTDPNDFSKPKSKHDLVARLVRLGYHPVPIPFGSKGPTIAGWDKLRLTEDQVPAYFPDEKMLVGALHDNLGAFDVDVYDPELAATIRDEAMRRFPDALERVGSAPKTAIVFRLENAYRVSNTEKHSRVTEDGEVFEAQVEIRTTTRQMVVYGIHPDTRQPYTWPRGELWATHIDMLPVITEQEAKDFRDWANTTIRAWAGVVDVTVPSLPMIATGHAPVIDLGMYRQTDAKPSEESFLTALGHVPAHAGYNDGWCDTLMAIHDYYGGSEHGLQVAKSWSSADSRYNPREVEAKWRSFKSGGGISYKSVFHSAKQYGADLAAIGRIDRPVAKAAPATSFDYKIDTGPSAQPIATATSYIIPQAETSEPKEQWKLQTASEFTSDFVAPEYIVDGVIRRGMLYTLTAPTGSGKTAVMLYASTAIAQGDLFYDREVEGGDVIFMAGENPDDVRARMIATMEYYQIDPSKCRVHFIPGTFSIRTDMDRIREAASHLPNLVLVVIDTFAAYFDGDDENSNAQALDFARVARMITKFPSKPAVIMPAHPVKNATRSNLAPKGGSSLVNEVDGNLTLWNEGGIITMHWQVKFRGAEFEPLSFELQRHESEKLRDAKGRLMPTILARPMLQMRAIEIASENMTLEDKLILNIQDAPALSMAERAVSIGAGNKMKVKRLLDKLAQQKLIRKFRTNWELTKEGERAADVLLTGGGFAKETDV